jgi:hypothetical protein
VTVNGRTVTGPVEQSGRRAAVESARGSMRDLPQTPLPPGHPPHAHAESNFVS